MANEYIYNTSYYNTWGQVGSNGANGVFTVGVQGGADRQGAIRFTNIYIAQGISVYSSSLQVYVSTNNGIGMLRAKLKGIAEDNTADFAGGSPMGRPSTGADEDKNGTTPGVGTYWGINTKNIVNEILSRAGWVSGNAIGFKIYNNGSDADNYIRDVSYGTYLEILTEVRPNFYPSAVSVTAPANSDAKTSWGIKIAHPGYDVLTADDKHIQFSSNRPILKAQFYGLDNVSVGVIKQIPHNLGYKGAYLVFARQDYGGGSYSPTRRLPCIIVSNDKSEHYAYGYIDNTNLNVDSFGFSQGDMGIDMQIYYYIFIDDISL